MNTAQHSICNALYKLCFYQVLPFTKCWYVSVNKRTATQCTASATLPEIVTRVHASHVYVDSQVTFLFSLRPCHLKSMKALHNYVSVHVIIFLYAFRYYFKAPRILSLSSQLKLVLYQTHSLSLRVWANSARASWSEDRSLIIILKLTLYFVIMFS